jgi:hypothetical protein
MTPLVFTLPEKISVTSENTLVPFLRQHADVAVEVSAERLRRLDTPLVQTLLAAAADRRTRGIPFRLTGLGPDQVARLAGLGVTSDLLQTGGVA